MNNAMLNLPHLTEVLQEVAYDNGMVHRGSTEDTEVEGMLANLRAAYTPEQIRALDITLSGYTPEQRKQIAVDPEAYISEKFRAAYKPFHEMLDYAFDPMSPPEPGK